MEFFHNLKDLTEDSEGYIYYKGVHVEHFSYRDDTAEKEAAKDLHKVCLFLEEHGIEPNIQTCVWSIDQALEKNGHIKVSHIVNTCIGEVGIAHFIDEKAFVLTQGIEPVSEFQDYSFFKIDSLKKEECCHYPIEVKLSDIPCDSARQKIERFIHSGYSSDQAVSITLKEGSSMYPSLEVEVLLEHEKIKAPSISLDEKTIPWFFEIWR